MVMIAVRRFCCWKSPVKEDAGAANDDAGCMEAVGNGDGLGICDVTELADAGAEAKEPPQNMQKAAPV